MAREVRGQCSCVADLGLSAGGSSAPTEPPSLRACTSFSQIIYRVPHTKAGVMDH